MNRWRSPTAEKLYGNSPLVNARSAGTRANARKRVSLSDIGWADIIIVMETRHKRRLDADFREAMRGKTVHVLDIEDDYPFMDPALVQELRTAIDAILEGYV